MKKSDWRGSNDWGDTSSGDRRETSNTGSSWHANDWGERHREDKGALSRTIKDAPASALVPLGEYSSSETASWEKGISRFRNKASFLYTRYDFSEESTVARWSAWFLQHQDLPKWKFNEVESFDFSETYLSDDGFSILIDTLKKSGIRKILRFKFHKNNLAKIAPLSLAPELMRYTRELHFSHNAIKDVEASTIMASLRAANIWKCAVWLRLEHNQIGNAERAVAEAQAMAPGLVVMQNDKISNIEDCHIVLYYAFFKSQRWGFTSLPSSPPLLQIMDAPRGATAEQ